MDKLISKMVGKKVDGNVFGLEVEVEGDFYRLCERGGRNFNVERDGSLRNGGAEFILATPCDAKALVLRYRRLLANIKEDVGKQTGQAGIHIHVNVTDLTVSELLTMYTILVCAEPCISKLYHPSRQYSLFALPVAYAQEIVDFLCLSHRFRPTVLKWWKDLSQYKYCNINLASVARNGTIELRGLETLCSHRKLSRILNVLEAAKEMAKEYNTPMALIESLSDQGVKFVIDQLFGEDAQELFNQKDCMDNLRIIQPLAYLCDSYEEEKPEGITKENFFKTVYYEMPE